MSAGNDLRRRDIAVGEDPDGRPAPAADEDAGMIEAAPDHARLQELVAGFADGELSADQSGRIQEHLRTCARCRRELTLQQSVSRALARDLPREDGAPLQQRLASARLRRQVEQIGPPAPAKRALPWTGRWAPRAAAALVLIG